jgi:uncharacterized protein (TIRG00374 family)
MPRLAPRIRAFLGRHLFLYLATIVALVVLVSIILGRDELARAWRHFDRRLMVPILALSLANYGLRFTKWHQLLGAVDVRVPLIQSARIFFACFTMVVTPARLGEAYKVVFLRRLRGASLRRTAPVLFVERLTDALAILALAAVRLDLGHRVPVAFAGTLVASVVLGALAGHEGLRTRLVALLARVPGVRGRVEVLDQLATHNAALLAPRALVPALAWSTLGWFCECLGLWLVLVGLGASIGWIDATWVYAVSTALGNLTFLPGGLGSTEASMVALLRTLAVPMDAALAATLLVRAATLWFAVFLGLAVSWQGRRALQWEAVRREAAALE